MRKYVLMLQDLTLAEWTMYFVVMKFTIHKTEYILFRFRRGKLRFLNVINNNIFFIKNYYVKP